MTAHDPANSTPVDQTGDDFRKITGIGTTYERGLHDAGILTYHDLATRSPEEISACLADVAKVSPARIASEDWTGQASQLAGPLDPLPSEPSQHYASFHVELLLDVDNSVRRTKVHHHQSDTDFSWPGWDEDRLLALLREHIPLTTSRPPAEDIDVPSPVAPPASQPETAVPSRSEPETGSQLITVLPSSLHIEEFAPIHEGQSTHVWATGEPASVRLTVCVDPSRTLRAAAFDFTADITARGKLGDRQRRPLGTMKGAVRVGEPLSVELTGPPLPRGLYRLEAEVSIYPTDYTPDSQPLHRRHVLGGTVPCRRCAGTDHSGHGLDSFTRLIKRSFGN